MSDGEGKKVKLWDFVEYDEPDPNSQGEEIRGAIDAGLLKFDHHREALLTILRDVHHDGGASEPFEEGKWWIRLTNLAGTYFWEARIRDETMPSGERARRLRILANILRKAGVLIEAAVGDDVGDALFSAWQEERNEPRASLVRNDDGSFALIRPLEEMFRKEVAGIAALQAAAHKAADEARSERLGGGRPPGTSALPAGYILTLADYFRQSTATDPVPSKGPFVGFVRKFLDAIGQKDRITERHLIETIEGALARERKSPTGPLPSSNSRE